jgi:hypothetical protein
VSLTENFFSNFPAIGVAVSDEFIYNNPTIYTPSKAH